MSVDPSLMSGEGSSDYYDSDQIAAFYAVNGNYPAYYYPNHAYDGHNPDENAPSAHPDHQEYETPTTPASPTAPTSSSRKNRANAEAGPFFNPTKQLCSLYSMDRTRSYVARLSPRIDRGFFLSDSDWTCYRRNYFQVSISYTASDAQGNKIELPCLLELEGRGIRTVTEFMVGVMARTSNGSREIDLIQHTAKRDKGPQMVPQPKHCEPQDPAVAFGMNRNDSHDFHTVIFERLQFKSATANNGKRRAAQQYHVVFAELLARCEDGCIARVASTESAPLVVRGRAPGHYAQLGGKKGSGSKKGDDDDEEEDTEDGDGYSTQQHEEAPRSADVSQEESGRSAAGADYNQEYGMQNAAAAHHMNYTAYSAPDGQSGQSSQGQYYHPGYPYYHPHYADATVWASAAAAAAAAQRNGEAAPEGYEYPYAHFGDTIPGSELAAGQLPTPQAQSPKEGEKRAREDTDSSRQGSKRKRKPKTSTEED